jgi:hypothetical protein
MSQVCETGTPAGFKTRLAEGLARWRDKIQQSSQHKPISPSQESDGVNYETSSKV